MDEKRLKVLNLMEMSDGGKIFIKLNKKLKNKNWCGIILKTDTE